MKNLNRSPLNAQKGFTLIELVVVIVILGILAATAAPKFIDLTGDAKAATMQAVRASVESANSMAHAKALVGGQTGDTGSIDVNGSTTGGVVNLVKGWPKAELASWAELLDVDLHDATSETLKNAAFDAVVGTDDSKNVIIWYSYKGSDYTVTEAKAQNCYVKYEEGAASTTKPIITPVTSGC